MPPKTQVEKTTFIKKASEVTAVDKSGTVFKGFHIWSDIAPAAKENPDLLFAKCLVLPGSTPTVFKCRQVEPIDPSEQEFEVKQSNAFNYNANMDAMSFSDIGMIPHTNVPSVLDFIKQRFLKSQIYSTAEPLLVAMNPFKDLGVASDAIITQYREAQDIEKLPPHVFTIARRAADNLNGVKKSQTIIVCGESGAGKTEATKQIMRYFASGKGGTQSDGRIQKAVLAANPVLEAFGNAKTLRNNNSSRFGRFMQLALGPSGGIFYGTILNFLLEKSRVVAQVDDERSYHIFYQLAKGADSAMKNRLSIKPVEQYKFLNPSCVRVDGIDDVEEFNEVSRSLDFMGMTPEEKESIFSIVSGILEIGNVMLEPIVNAQGHEGAGIVSATRPNFDKACELLFLDKAAIEEGLTVKYTSAGGNTVKGTWSPEDARILQQSLAKAIYEKFHMDCHET